MILVHKFGWVAIGKVWDAFPRGAWERGAQIDWIAIGIVWYVFPRRAWERGATRRRLWLGEARSWLLVFVANDVDAFRGDEIKYGGIDFGIFFEFGEYQSGDLAKGIG